MPPLSISEIFGGGEGKNTGKEKNIAGKLKCPLKALFLVLLNDCTELYADIQCL